MSDDGPTLEQIEVALREAERMGLMEQVRDELGNAVTKLGSDGRPHIVWRRTTKRTPRAANY